MHLGILTTKQNGSSRYFKWNSYVSPRGGRHDNTMVDQLQTFFVSDRKFDKLSKIPHIKVGNVSLSYILPPRYHEVQKQPWHSEDGSCCSQTLRAHHEVKGGFQFKFQNEIYCNDSFQCGVRAGCFMELSSSGRSSSILANRNHLVLKLLLPSTGHVQHCIQHCMPTDALLTGSVLQSCILFLNVRTPSELRLGIVMTPKHHSSLTHTCWCVFPPLVLSLWVVTCPGTVRAAEDV